MIYVDPSGLSHKGVIGHAGDVIREVLDSDLIKTAFEVGISLAPGVGEIMDLGVVIAPNSTPVERALAVTSLGVSIVTIGTSPNFGTYVRAARRLGKGLRKADNIVDVGRGLARTATRAEDVATDLARAARRGADDVATGVGKGVSRTPAGGICFVAGTPVVLACNESADVQSMPIAIAAVSDEDPGHERLLACCCTIVGLVGLQFDDRRKRQTTSAENDSSGRGPKRNSLSDLPDPRKQHSGATPSDQASVKATKSFVDESVTERTPLRGEEVGAYSSAEAICAMTRTRATQDNRIRTSGDLSRFRPARWALIACLLFGLLFCGRALRNGHEPGELQIPTLTSAAERPLATAPIEAIRVGQRVLTSKTNRDQSVVSAVDERTWRRLALEQVDTWADGTVDRICVESLLPPEWLALHDGAPVGSRVPIPLDLVEMGLPEGMTATVMANEPCPPISHGPGRVVLTTVNHLNPRVVELTIEAQDGTQERTRPTALHKFYSETRDEWISAEDLRPGENIRGLGGPLQVVSLRAIPGTHRVYNMTVEGEHVYHVSTLGVLAHNNNCAMPTPTTHAVDTGYYPKTPGTGVVDTGYYPDVTPRTGEGLTTPNKYFGGKTYTQVDEALTKKFGPPRGQGPYNKSFYDPRTKRTFNLHKDPSHRGGLPHVDVRKRGLPTDYYKEQPFFLLDE